ncbi:hypothetical protein [Azospirillum argentinense]|uniref:hypothetical protein n=1 Tax=Azospirillum argentinense TaxID=2970906 RepID=UPI0032DF59D6
MQRNTDTDTAPLSARLRERIVLLNCNGAEPLMQKAAHALDALSARVAELEADARKAGYYYDRCMKALDNGDRALDTAEGWKARATQAEAERDALRRCGLGLCVIVGAAQGGE